VVAWRWVIGPWNTQPQRELTLAYNRHLSFNLTAPAAATFSLPGRTDEAAALTEMLTDMWVYADNTLVYRGRIIAITDTVAQSGHTVAVTCTDYRGLLSRRLLVEGDQLNWSTATYAAIAWGLVQSTQAKTGGGLGVTQGVWQADTAQPPSGYRVRNYQPGAEIAKTLDDLAAVAFDYQIDPALKMNLWAPGKTHTSAFVADYGGTVIGFTRAATATGWANVVRVSGDATQTVAVNLATNQPEGRFEQQIGYPDVVLQDTLAQRAPTAQTDWLTRRSSLNIDLRPGIIAHTADVDVGSQITVALRSGRIHEVGTRTIQQLDVNLDDTGVTHTRLGLLVG
jgi:hypothetical protein